MQKRVPIVSSSGLQIPRVADVRAYIREQVSRCERAGAVKLPALAAMASACGVSRSTVARACRALAAEGLLECRRGSGVYLARHRDTRQPQSPEKTVPRWRVTVGALLRDIEAGHYLGAAVLPTAKELGARYGVCNQTVRRALYHLVRRGVLRYERKRYAPVRRSSSAASGGIVFVCRGWWRWKDFPAEMSRTLRLFESTCGELGVVPAVVLLAYRDRRLVPVAGRGVEAYARDEPPGALGFIVRAGDCPDDAFAPAIAPLAGAGAPVAIWDRRGRSTIPSLFGGRAQVFRSTDDCRAGQEVGDAVLRAGGRTVWYVSPYGDTAWSRERLRGLTERVRAAGAALRTVECSTTDAFDDPDMLRESLSRARERILDRIIDTADPAEQQFAYGLSHTLGEVTGEVRRRQMRRVVRGLVQPHLSNIINDHSAAIVGCNDLVSQECMQLMTTRRAGRGIGVYGFDDSFAATLNRFSSYNFNDHGAIRALIASILYPAAMRRTHGRGGRERRVDGFVTVRER